jgi:hypothetical protein
MKHHKIKVFESKKELDEYIKKYKLKNIQKLYETVHSETFQPMAVYSAERHGYPEGWIAGYFGIYIDVKTA